MFRCVSLVALREHSVHIIYTQTMCKFIINVTCMFHMHSYQHEHKYLSTRLIAAECSLQVYVTSASNHHLWPPSPCLSVYIPCDQFAGNVSNKTVSKIVQHDGNVSNKSLNFLETIQQVRNLSTFHLRATRGKGQGTGGVGAPMGQCTILVNGMGYWQAISGIKI